MDQLGHFGPGISALLAASIDRIGPEGLAVVMAVFGLLFGSFANVVIARVPEGLSVVHPPSKCPRCDHQIAWYDNIPIVSWVILGAKCRSCAQPIRARYPLVEGTMAVLFGGTTLWLARLGDVVALPGMLIFVFASTCLFAIDIDTLRLPDKITKPLAVTIWLFLGAAAWVNGDTEKWWSMVFGVAFIAGLLFVIHWVYPPAMGLGDVKYALSMGAALGYFGYGSVLVGYFVAILVGALWGLLLMVKTGLGKRRHLPFGPSLVIGAFVGCVYGESLFRIYLDLSGL